MTEPEKTRILITNDDGIEFKGIHKLAIAIEEAGYDVVVAAPNYEASGTGAALGNLGALRTIALERHSISGLQGDAFGIAAPPAACVLLGNLGAFGDRPHAVVSGINAGMNGGRATLHSGTIGAALAAQNFGLRGLAVSLMHGEHWYWETAASIAVEVLPAVVNGPERCLMNLNVPPLPLDQVKGIRWASIAKYNATRSEVDKIENDEVSLRMVRVEPTSDPMSDLATVTAGYAALTSLHAVVEVWDEHIDTGDLFENSHIAPGVLKNGQLRIPGSFFI